MTMIRGWWNGAGERMVTNWVVGARQERERGKGPVFALYPIRRRLVVFRRIQRKMTRGKTELP